MATLKNCPSSTKKGKISIVQYQEYLWLGLAHKLLGHCLTEPASSYQHFLMLQVNCLSTWASALYILLVT
jgi:hypothetical protein